MPGTLILYILILLTYLGVQTDMPSTPYLKLSCWNARGYLSAIPYLRQLLGACDILAVSEHWLHSNRLGILDDITVTHNVFARASRASEAANYGSNRGQGGVALFWRKDLAGISVVSDVTHDRVCIIRLQTPQGGIFNLISVYFPAQGCDEDLRTCLDEIAEIVESREANSHCIIMGDCNGDVGSAFGGRGTYPATRQGVLLANFFKRYNLVPCNMLNMTEGPVHTFESHNALTTLDYIAVPSWMSGSIITSTVHEDHMLNNSDHLAVSVTMDFGQVSGNHVHSREPSRVRWDKLSIVDRNTRYAEKVDSQVNIIRDTYLSTGYDAQRIDMALEALTQAIMTVSEDLPHSTYRKHLKPYWNADLTRLKQLKVNTYRKWVMMGRPREQDNVFYIAYKKTKKDFLKTLVKLSKQYENDEVLEAVRLAEVNRNSFWRLIQKSRKSGGGNQLSIKRQDGTVVNDIKDVLEVWRNHFASLGQENDSPTYDRTHFDAVTQFASNYNLSEANDDMFLVDPILVDEVRNAIRSLNRGKSPGFDKVSSEHIAFGGPNLTSLLCEIFNMIIDIEYIPVCFRYGIQVPLFKGKDLSNLDPNNYRGITLLSTYNKLFEIVLWNRLKGWWVDSGVISELQGACKSGLSCIHTAFSLQETIATSLEDNNKCYVAFYDVSKAFDGVWIDGLFRQMYDSGITGKTWRLLYRSYVDFRCCAKVQGHLSATYTLHRGIHQGGFMSLIKYTVFINSLLVHLKNSGYCCKLYQTPSTPVGYADDLATACVNNRKLERVMDIVYRHGCTWRYEFNAKKSGVLVYGEDRNEHKHNVQHRAFRLGPAKVSERESYDHVGIRAIISDDDVSGIEERLSKARRTFNAVSGIGIRSNGLTMATCNVIFWTIVVPAALYGSEIWILNAKAVAIIEAFQIYACKRIQRLYSRVPNAPALYALGWMRLERYIQVKKMLFIRSIMTLDDQTLSRKVFCERATILYRRPGLRDFDNSHSVVFDLLEVASTFNMHEEVKDMVERDRHFSKGYWKERVWARAWELEDVYWMVEFNLHQSLDLLHMVCYENRYLTWWAISDRYPQNISVCETLAKLVCHASLLKVDDVRLKGSSLASKFCTLCDLGQKEDVRHLVLQCPTT